MDIFSVLYWYLYLRSLILKASIFYNTSLKLSQMCVKKLLFLKIFNFKICYITIKSACKSVDFKLFKLWPNLDHYWGPMVLSLIWGYCEIWNVEILIPKLKQEFMKGLKNDLGTYGRVFVKYTYKELQYQRILMLLCYMTRNCFN